MLDLNMIPTLNHQRWLKQKKFLSFLSGMMTGQNGALQLAWDFSPMKGQLDMQGDVSPGCGGYYSLTLFTLFGQNLQFVYCQNGARKGVW